ncbi:hypothetical protein MIH18_23705 (plasmid) [Marinobacter sp. M3C]|jgi:translation initiation factor 2B subunit (eIF-2B alpha/beta/delta family)|uniref:hypothetical protein n=1 Tax=Marinobacter sp. M3C TaxID=2917715 RepID=UPI00200F0CFC|nr:hypothetical protein [Marinobacter sp. M3C]UQG62838.1 hypothetical protein MIH18_23705 [Marinobacter sp. M3C]
MYNSEFVVFSQALDDNAVDLGYESGKDMVWDCVSSQFPGSDHNEIQQLVDALIVVMEEARSTSPAMVSNNFRAEWNKEIKRRAKEVTNYRKLFEKGGVEAIAEVEKRDAEKEYAKNSRFYDSAEALAESYTLRALALIGVKK